MLKICFAASSGGHLEEVLRLAEMLSLSAESFLLTEKTGYPIRNAKGRVYYLHQVNRKEWSCPFFLMADAVYALLVFLKEKPDAVISTGALAAVPACLIAKAMGKKLIFMETFAVIDAPTRTGRLLYHLADRFYVQWDSMKKYYPKAVCLGGVYGGRKP